MFVIVEGIDAAGKATQSRMLADKLEGTLFSFPDYETPMGHIIKGHLLRYWSSQSLAEGVGAYDTGALNAFVFQALQLTNRMEHATKIQQLMDDKRHVVADRYWPSGWVYGQADGLDAEWLIRIQDYLPEPHLYILLDVDHEQSVKRRPERRDRYEKQQGLMEKVAGLYRKLWVEKFGSHHNWVVVDGNGSVGEVHDAILKAAEQFVHSATQPHKLGELPWVHGQMNWLDT